MCLNLRKDFQHLAPKQAPVIRLRMDYQHNCFIGVGEAGCGMHYFKFAESINFVDFELAFKEARIKFASSASEFPSN